MSNLLETSTFDAGVFQIETSTPVLGGPGGPSNSQAQALANRTRYLKDHVDALEQAAPDMASKSYVQGELQKLDSKQSVRMATTASVVLSDTQTIDGVVGAVGDRVLVKAQTNGAQNGIYVMGASGWSRAVDADATVDITPGMLVSVEEGTVGADSQWLLTSNAPLILDTSVLTFEDVNRGNVRLGGSTMTGPLALAANSTAPAPAAADKSTKVPNTAWVGANTPGRLLRTLVYSRIGGVQNVSINGGANTTAGAGTYTPLAEMKTIIAQAQGAGNGGAGGAAPSTGNVSMGSPGGCGAYGSGIYTAAQVGASQVITVGVGGGSAAAGNGVAGGASSLGSLLSAPGGIGALALNNFPAGNNANGNGSSTALPTGANLECVAGYCANQSLIINAGVSSGILAASGMSTRFGNGGQGAFNADGGAAPGLSYGAGGGTVALTNPTTAKAGGSGAGGVVIIREFT